MKWGWDDKVHANIFYVVSANADGTSVKPHAGQG